MFQNRYSSEVVEADEYLINVLRYIQQNPVKAKMVNGAKEYLWSSYHQYLLDYAEQGSFLDTELIKGYFSSVKDFENYMNVETKEEFLDYKRIKKSTDTAIKNMIEKEIKIEVLIQMPIEKRNRIIKDIYQHAGVSIRQLARVLGTGKGLIEKAVK